MGYHSEWNLGSPGGWDYQRVTQIIGKAVWDELNKIRPSGVRLDFDHPLLFPIYGFVDMLVSEARSREAVGNAMIAVVAEEETLEDVAENRNLVDHLNRKEGIESALMAPQAIELHKGRVSFQGDPVSLIFMDFNTDVFLSLHRRHDLSPLLQAVKERRVINPRGTEPINIKSMFEVITGEERERFHREVVDRTPWTRRFYERKTLGPRGEPIKDLVEWAGENWDDLVLKPERGYSGKGVRVGNVNSSAEEAIAAALGEGGYILQEKVPLDLWAEDIPTVDRERGEVRLDRFQTDFRCLMGPSGLMGFLGRFGGVPTNVGSGGGVQPLAVLDSEMSVREAVARINKAILSVPYSELLSVFEMQERMALEENFTYLLGPIKIALRPRVITPRQIESLERYCASLWSDCLTLEKMWQRGELDHMVGIEPDELAIARLQPWEGSAAIIASDGLFGFGSI